MQSSVLNNPKLRMGNHLVALKKYAERVLIDGEELIPWEEADKAARLEDFFNVGQSFKCTERELVAVLIRDLVKERQP